MYALDVTHALPVPILNSCAINPTSVHVLTSSSRRACDLCFCIVVPISFLNSVFSALLNYWFTCRPLCVSEWWAKCISVFPCSIHFCLSRMACGIFCAHLHNYVFSALLNDWFRPLFFLECWAISVTQLF